MAPGKEPPLVVHQYEDDPPTVRFGLVSAPEQAFDDRMHDGEASIATVIATLIAPFLPIVAVHQIVDAREHLADLVLPVLTGYIAVLTFAALIRAALLNDHRGQVRTAAFVVPWAALAIYTFTWVDSLAWHCVVALIHCFGLTTAFSRQHDLYLTSRARSRHLLTLPWNQWQDYQHPDTEYYPDYARLPLTWSEAVLLDAVGNATYDQSPADLRRLAQACTQIGDQRAKATPDIEAVSQVEDEVAQVAERVEAATAGADEVDSARHRYLAGRAVGIEPERRVALRERRAHLDGVETDLLVRELHRRGFIVEPAFVASEDGDR